MDRPFDIVTFDCYGTLVDWEGGICAAFRDEAALDGRQLDREAVLRAHAAIEPAVQAGPFRSYREVLTETARRIGARLGWEIDEDRAGFLADSLSRWEPFPDTNAALRRLIDADYRLGILSNVDDDLLDATLRQLDVRFELIVTAEQVRSYKPHHGHFQTTRQRIGEAAWLHAAQSYFHDVIPATALGIRVAWINRKSEPAAGHARPDRGLHNLAELADWLVRI